MRRRLPCLLSSLAGLCGVADWGPLAAESSPPVALEAPPGFRIEWVPTAPPGAEPSTNAVLDARGGAYRFGSNLTPAAPHSPYRGSAADALLPPLRDTNQVIGPGETVGTHLFRADHGSAVWQLFAGGFHAPRAMALSVEGEVWVIDGENEESRGLPWYQPARLLHVVSGGEYGWRPGGASWPEGYPDALPSLFEVGLASLVALKSGAPSAFPSKYREAMFVLDAAQGRVWSLRLRPQGASYKVTPELFIHGPGLGWTNLAFGPDGALYLSAGGGASPGAAYRLRYLGPDTSVATRTPAEAAELEAAVEARALRRRLEGYHGAPNADALALAWPHLDSSDRWIRYAARLAIEAQPVHGWRERALTETNRAAALASLLALARVGPPSAQARLLERWTWLIHQGLTELEQLEAARLVQLACIRMGRPEAATRQAMIAALTPIYPAPSAPLNRELCALLVYLEAPGVVPATLALLEAAPTLEEQMQYLLDLRGLSRGWTLDQRRQYFHWLNRVGAGGAPSPQLARFFRDASQPYRPGSAFVGSLTRLRQEAAATLSESDRQALWPVISGQALYSVLPPTNRAAFHAWTVDELAPLLPQIGPQRSLSRGKAAFTAAQCLACHRFGAEGGSVGPDLTAVAQRLGLRDLLESIVRPSTVVADPYRGTHFVLKDGEEMTGRVLEEDDQCVRLTANALTGTQAVLKKSDLHSRLPAKLSPMPEGLVNLLTQDEVLDLLAYLHAGAPLPEN